MSLEEMDWEKKGDSIISLFLKSKKNSNSIVDLEEMLLADDENCILASINTVKCLFTEIFSRKMMFSSSSLSEVELSYRTWLSDRYNDFVSHLLGYLSHTASKIQELALQSLITFVQLEGKYPMKTIQKNEWYFPRPLFEKIVFALASHVLEQLQLITKFQEYTQYDDVKLYLLKSLQRLFKQTDKVTDIFLWNCFYLLRSNNYPVKFHSGNDNEMSVQNTLLSQAGVETPFYLNDKSYCRLFSSIWEQFLKYELPLPLFRQVLLTLPDNVLPYLKNPCIMTDFFTNCYNKGGITSLLSLGGLYILMQKYNVEYPDFYVKLYAVFDESSVNGNYSSKFFYLSDLILSSTHLPAYLVAAFVKKLSRLSLISNTSSIFKIILFICNLLIRHPSLNVLVHRTNSAEFCSDPFDPFVANPADSKAIDSSLWEIKTLQSHINPDISRKAKLINMPLPKLEFIVKVYRDIVMNDLYYKERRRKFSEAPLAIKKPTSERWWVLKQE